MPIKILFLADTHLGFDLPFKPRVKRPRRGPDFFRMFEQALEPAMRGEVDAVIHGGDILFRSKVPPQLVQMAFEPLHKVADKGIPVYVVPGNHERSAIPYRLWASHPNIHIFVRPRTFIQEIRGQTLALAGFPYIRDNIRQHFPHFLSETGWNRQPSDAALLCIHHCIEGASLQMGSRMYVFRNNSDVIRARDLPTGFAAILSGHIHRFQVLESDLQGTPPATPVFYPGSTERTSFVEKDEPKGFLILEIETESGSPGGSIAGWRFHPLPARPMTLLELNTNAMTEQQTTPTEIKKWLNHQLAGLPVDSVVKIRIRGQLPPDSQILLSATSLRQLAPETMNISIGIPRPNNRQRFE